MSLFQRSNEFRVLSIGGSLPVCSTKTCLHGKTMICVLYKYRQTAWNKELLQYFLSISVSNEIGPIERLLQTEDCWVNF